VLNHRPRGQAGLVQRIVDLLVDMDSTAGRAVSTVVVLVAAVLLAEGLGRLVTRRVDDPTSRYYGRKAVRWVTAIIALIVVAVMWRAFAGRAGVVLGFATAGVAFAMQEVIGALAGGMNIIFGRIFGVGDRIQMGGVRGDVIDITPLRTKIMEMGSAGDEDSWVKGRQYTGRIVAVSNKATFTEPVYNYSAGFEYLWEELTLPIPHDADWATAERILQEEAEHISGSIGARQAIAAMTRRYPVPRTEVAPRVFLRSTDNWMELSARFVVPVRTARSTKDDLTRRVMERLQEAEIPIASETIDASVELRGS
jgi:small-conductance mechanosensitive channel